ncbi:MAG: DUF494 family protein [Gammaproteobacteria bacterium]
MKENVLDVLVYLFENYLDADGQSAPDEDTVREELEELGFPGNDIEKALRWLEELANFQRTGKVPHVQAAHSLRHYTVQETRRIDPDSQGFLLYLEQNGILDNISRELVIDRAMALEGDDITLEQIKWVVLLVLFNQPGQEAAFAWMHDLVYDVPSGMLH